jgi:TRAP-type C4-dicarboxylate transport system permease small subunit
VHTVRRLRALHDRLTAIGFAGAALSVAIICVSFWYEVVARYFLAAPTVWAYAVASYALCPMIFLAMPEMSRRGAHIAIEYLTDALPAKYRRPLAWTVTLATALVCLMGAWITGAETWRQHVQGIETVLAFAVPKWWVSMFIAYGLLSSAIYFLRRLFEPPPVNRTDEAIA